MLQSYAMPVPNCGTGCDIMMLFRKGQSNFLKSKSLTEQQAFL